jgi:hypothetical protein
MKAEVKGSFEVKSVSEFWVTFWMLIWISGPVIAHGFISTTVAIFFPPYAVYLLLERFMLYFSFI